MHHRVTTYVCTITVRKVMCHRLTTKLCRTLMSVMYQRYVPWLTKRGRSIAHMLTTVVYQKYAPQGTTDIIQFCKQLALIFFLLTGVTIYTFPF